MDFFNYQLSKIDSQGGELFYTAAGKLVKERCDAYLFTQEELRRFIVKNQLNESEHQVFYNTLEKAGNGRQVIHSCRSGGFGGLYPYYHWQLAGNGRLVQLYCYDGYLPYERGA